MSNASYRPLVQASFLEAKGTESVDNFINSLFSSQVRVRVSPGTIAEETQIIGNNILLGSGTHHGFVSSKPHTVITGEPGTIVDRLVEIQNHAVISNVHFKQLNDPSNENSLVQVNPVATATLASPVRILFRNCIFERRFDAPRDASASSTIAFVVVNPFAKAVFTDCVFRSNLASGAMNGSGIAIQNLNAAATDVYVTSGVNFSTHNHNNVTVSGPEI